MAIALKIRAATVRACPELDSGQALTVAARIRIRVCLNPHSTLLI